VLKSTLFVMCFGGLLMSSASALAQNAPAPAAPATQAAPADDPNEIICHAEPILGSRFPGPRTCHTRKEWDQIRKDSQDALFHQQMERSSDGSGK
jgi:hypothetical protein